MGMVATKTAPTRKMPSRGPMISRQAKAGVTLSVARITKMLRKSQAKYVSTKAPLYMAGVMEIVVDSVVKQAVEHARNGPRNSHGGLVVNRVNNVDVIHAVRSDPDLARLCTGFAFASNARPTKPIMHILSAEGQKRRSQQKASRAAISKSNSNNTGLD